MPSFSASALAARACFLIFKLFIVKRDGKWKQNKIWKIEKWIQKKLQLIWLILNANALNEKRLKLSTTWRKFSIENLIG